MLARRCLQPSGHSETGFVHLKPKLKAFYSADVSNKRLNEHLALTETPTGSIILAFKKEHDEPLKKNTMPF